MWDEEVIFVDGDQYFNALKESIENAKKSIRLEVYIFAFDSIGKKILELLAAAANRQVNVRILLDGFGASNWNFAQAENWRNKGIEINFFHPLPWQIKPSILWRIFSLQRIALGYFKFKHRNHRKTCVIDEKTLLIGSCNIIDCHVPSIVGKDAWRDTSAKLSGPGVTEFVETYDRVWHLTDRYHGLKWLRAVKKQKKIKHKHIIQQIRYAKKKIWITNPYFVPDLKFLKALCYASKSGVDVKILLPNEIHILFFKFAVQAYYTMLITYGVEIYEYNASMLHAKVLIIDDWVNIGSSNLDFRSIYYNLECNAPIEGSNSIKFLEEQFLKDLKTADKIDLQTWRNRSWVIRILEKFFLLFKNIL